MITDVLKTKSDIPVNSDAPNSASPPKQKKRRRLVAAYDFDDLEPAQDVNSEPTPTPTNEPAQSSPQQKPARFKRRAHKPKRAKIPESEITDFTIQEEQTPSSPIPVDPSQALMVEPLQAVPITDATPLSPTTSPKASPTASAVDEEIRCDEPVTAAAGATQSDCQTPLSDHGQIPQSPMKIPKDAIVHDTAPENYKSDAVEESDKVAVEALQSLAQTGEEPIKSQSEDKGKSAQDNVEKVADPVPADEKANSDTEDDTSSDTDKDDNAEIPLTQQKWESTSQFNARFCQLIFSYCFPDVPIPETGNELPFKITKRAFTDLIKKDSKKPQVPVFAIPVTVQDKLRVALPDKYTALFSDENIPQPSPSTVDPEQVPTSCPSQKGPVVKSTHTLPSGSSQQGPVAKYSPKRILRSTKSPTKPSPPPRKRRFLQKISDSESDEAPPPPPPAKKQRKKIKPTTITDLTVEPLQSEDPTQALIPFSDQPSSAEPVMIEPITAIPLDTIAADTQMSESFSEHNDQPTMTKSDEGLKLNQESLIQHEHIIAADTLVSEIASDVPNQSEDAQIEMVLQMIQDSLLQPEAIVAAPAQEITEAANSDAATEALESHTLSIFADDIDDDGATEVTSTPIQTPGLHLSISEPVRDNTTERADSQIKVLSPVKESSPIRALTVPSSPLPFSVPGRRKVCNLTYYQRMGRATPPSIEDRLTSIEATQMSMQHTLTDLSSSVAQLVQALTSDNVKKGEKVLKDKCKNDQLLIRKKSDDDDEEEKKEAVNEDKSIKQLVQVRSNKDAVSERPRESKQKHQSMELTVMSQAQNISKAVRDSDVISKEIALVNSEVEKQKEVQISGADKLIEAGDPESQKFCQTLKFRGRETTLFYKSPSLQAIDEAMARKIFEKENPGVDIEAIRLEEERLAAEKKKISKTKPRTRSQTQSESDAVDKGKKPVDGVPSVPPVIKRSVIKIASENPSQRMLKLSRNANIITNVSDQVEEKEAGLTRKRKGDSNPISDMTLTTNNAQVKVSATEEKVEDNKASRWSDLMKRTISEKRRFYGVKSNEEYISQIAQDDGSEISMEKNSSVMETIANTRILGYNNEADRPRVIQLGEAMQRSKVNALRAAIYKTGDETEELRNVKAQMIQTLKLKEENLINQFVRESYGYRLI
ncbi:uncharacterized protein LOC135147177 [Daucus carota subsp. sativus]|uniref:uncharacterized protein LOC135147177 n=1 Tax=Daucus carota subsp. sativus TaxID=79200 RepID=UPI0030828139